MADFRVGTYALQASGILTPRSNEAKMSWCCFAFHRASTRGTSANCLQYRLLYASLVTEPSMQIIRARPLLLVR